MKRLIKLLETFLSLDIDQIAMGIWIQEDVQTLIIDLNTQDQLFDEGVDSEGISLEDIGGPYAFSTIEGREGPSGFKGKKELGLPFDHITLFNKGIFYGSFRVIPSLGGFRIEAETVKDGVDLRIEWGKNILGLNNESKRKLKPAIAPLLKEEVARALFGRL